MWLHILWVLEMTEIVIVHDEDNFCIICNQYYGHLTPGKYLYKEFQCQCDLKQRTLEDFK